MNEAHSRAIVFLLAAILCVLLFGASAVLSGLAWLAVIGAVLAVLALLFFVARRLWPAAAELVRWFLTKGLALPVFAPLGEWRSIRERRARGERVGAIAAALTLLWTFVASVFVWSLFVCMPLLAVAYELRLWFR